LHLGDALHLGENDGHGDEDGKCDDDDDMPNVDAGGDVGGRRDSTLRMPLLRRTHPLEMRRIWMIGLLMSWSLLENAPYVDLGRACCAWSLCRRMEIPSTQGVHSFLC